MYIPYIVWGIRGRVNLCDEKLDDAKFAVVYTESVYAKKKYQIKYDLHHSKIIIPFQSLDFKRKTQCD